ncbi:MAG: PQQ-dependent sugar dehydrogenase [Phycisphaerales bacterium]|nr:PQQ-dependent sugar dehydrogenase [Phycisphaerales bacterium]
MYRKSIHRAMASAVACLGVTAALLTGSQAQAQTLAVEQVASGLSGALYLTSPPGDTHRLFVLQQNTGQIRIIKDGNVLTTPFLDVRTRISTGGERGLLGLAFHPDYDSNGYFFINYTNTSGNTVVARYEVTGDPDVADFNSEAIVLTVTQPYSNHNGGCLQFSPMDGYLYIGMGDGGSANDPGNRAQNGQELLGKILRINVDQLPYTIPADNPFVNDPAVRDEIWAIGMRNPWRFSFDRITGDMYLGDVGQGSNEEVDFELAGDGGQNYGWRCMEGTRCTGLSGCTCNAPTLTLPIYEYLHSGGRCSITGGYNYRGQSIPLLDNTYFFADYCSRNIYSFNYDGQQVTNFTDRTSELGGGSISSIASFGEDANGELYILSLGGTINKIVTKMKLEATDLIAGQRATLRVTNATPNGNVYFAYSLAGTGQTPIPPLNITVALQSPVLAGRVQANGSGVAILSRTVPSGTSGQRVWLQAGEQGETTNVITTVIQ